ncbi:MAG: alpha-1,2-fucosyltransferase [Nostoc indistinguendum CM1-VF10]|jgi:hypothetical protein|nr:alpha-1,2-fucosyltransferase [Nostoc indistinguendum CM1-VF10]
MQPYQTLKTSQLFNTSSNAFVDAQMPRCGLGNMLLVWAKAVLFAKLNGLPVLSPNWSEVRIGPWLRGERTKRYYANLFTTQDYYSRFRYYLQKSISQENKFYNPPLSQVEELNLEESKSYIRIIFNRMPPWNDYFQGLKQHQPFLKNRLIGMIRPSLLAHIYHQPSPCIGIHIRMGDYLEPKPGDDFSVQRTTRTPILWFARALQSVRDIAGHNLPATVFSDGYPYELEDILKLPNVSLSNNKCALNDLITLSRSQLIIASSHSSFSAWASYLGQCPTIWYLERLHLYEPIFLDPLREKIFEGGYNSEVANPPEILKQNIKQIVESIN